MEGIAFFPVVDILVPNVLLMECAVDHLAAIAWSDHLAAIAWSEHCALCTLKLDSATLATLNGSQAALAFPEFDSAVNCI